jgi:hypothetical protein
VLLLLLEFVVVVVGEGDSCVKKDHGVETEYHRRGTVQVNGHGAQSIKSWRTDNARDVCRKAMRQTEKRNATEQ